MEAECAEVLSLPLVIAQLSELDVTDQARVKPNKVQSGLLGTLLGSENSSHGKQERERKQGKGGGIGRGVGKRGHIQKERKA